MRIVQRNIIELGEINDRRVKSKNFRVLDEFRNSEYDCVEIEEYPHKSAVSCAASFASSIKRYRMHTIKAVQRKDRVFLVKLK